MYKSGAFFIYETKVSFDVESGGLVGRTVMTNPSSCSLFPSANAGSTCNTAFVGLSNATCLSFFNLKRQSASPRSKIASSLRFVNRGLSVVRRLMIMGRMALGKQVNEMRFLHKSIAFATVIENALSGLLFRDGRLRMSTITRVRVDA